MHAAFQWFDSLLARFPVQLFVKFASISCIFGVFKGLESLRFTKADRGSP